MELIKLGKKGQLSIPQSVLRALAIPPESPLLVDVTPDGAIVLRQAAVYPVEIYSDERVAEFERENTAPGELTARARRKIDLGNPGKRKRSPRTGKAR